MQVAETEKALVERLVARSTEAPVSLSSLPEAFAWGIPPELGDSLSRASGAGRAIGEEGHGVRTHSQFPSHFPFLGPAEEAGGDGPRRGLKHQGIRLW